MVTKKTIISCDICQDHTSELLDVLDRYKTEQFQFICMGCRNQIINTIEELRDSNPNIGYKIMSPDSIINMMLNLKNK